MARYTYIVLSTAAAGQEEAFKNWYENQHLADVARMPDVVSARLLFPTHQDAGALSLPAFTAMALYELESDDPKASIDAIFAKAGTPELPLSDDMDMSGLYQFIGYEARIIS